MIDASDSRVDRSTSVSSMRRINAPPRPRARSQLKSAVRALPTWRCPVGLGANLTRMKWLRADGAEQRDGVRRDRLAAADGVDALVRLAFDADAAGVDAARGRPAPSGPARPGAARPRDRPAW